MIVTTFWTAQIGCNFNKNLHSERYVRVQKLGKEWNQKPAFLDTLVQSTTRVTSCHHIASLVDLMPTLFDLDAGVNRPKSVL